VHKGRRNFLALPGIAAAGATSSFLPATILAKELESPPQKTEAHSFTATDIPSDGRPASAAIQRYIDMYGVVNLPAGKYLIDTPLIPRNGAGTIIRGSGAEVVTFIVPSNSTAIRYLREQQEPPARVLVDGITFLGHDMSAIGTIFHGCDGKDDDALSMLNCRFEGLLNCVWLRNCGECHFDRISVRFCVVGWVMERATNIIRFSGVLCVSNRRFLHLDDKEADGYTHGISLTNCHAIFCSEEDVYLIGGQTIYIDGCSFDLGIGGSAALVFKKCQDVRFSNGWMAAGVEGRDAAHIEDSNRWSITNSTINNCHRGIVIRGPGPYPTAGTIVGNQFGANRLNDIVLEGDVTLMVIQSNQFTSLDATFPDVKNRQEIVAFGSGNGSNIINNNIFAGVKYEIPGGVNSITEPNIWDGKGFVVKLVFDKYKTDYIPVHARFSLNDGTSLAEILKKYI